MNLRITPKARALVTLFLMFLLVYACQTEDEEILLEDHEEIRDISVEEVKEKYFDLKDKSGNLRQYDSIGIHWNGAAYKEMEFGDALFFPVDTDQPYYVSAGDDLVQFPVDGTSFVYAYKDSQEVHIEYYQPVITSSGKNFSGVILGSNWGESVSKVLFYENGEYIGTRRANVTAASSSIANRMGCFYVYWRVKDGYIYGGGYSSYTPGWWESFLVCVEGDDTIYLDGSGSSSVILEGGGAATAPGESEMDGLCPNPFVPGTYVKCSDLICPNGLPIDSWDEPCIDEEKPCEGDPVPNPEIAPQTNSGIEGGLHDTCARKDKTVCKGISGRKWHDGVDIKNEYGAPIYAMYDGTATKATQFNKKGEVDGAGYHVAVVSNVNGVNVRLVYFHMQETGRASGAVKAGDIIGYQGDSGNLKNAIEQKLTVSHVHIKARENGQVADPLNHFTTKIDPKTGKVTNPCN